MAKHGGERGFMNAASPGVICAVLAKRLLPDAGGLSRGLADAMKAEYETIVAAGLDLQLDCPDLALSRHMLFNDLSDDEFIKVAGAHVEALNHALSGIPADKSAHPHLLGQLRGAACLRHPHGADVRHAHFGQGALPAVRNLEPPPCPRMDRVPRSQGLKFPTTRCWCPASWTPRPTSSNTPTSWPSGSSVSWTSWAPSA